MFLIPGLVRMKPTKWKFFHKSGEKEGDPIILCGKGGLICIVVEFESTQFHVIRLAHLI